MKKLLGRIDFLYSAPDETKELSWLNRNGCEILYSYFKLSHEYSESF